MSAINEITKHEQNRENGKPAILLHKTTDQDSLPPHEEAEKKAEVFKKALKTMQKTVQEFEEAYMDFDFSSLSYADLDHFENELRHCSVYSLRNLISDARMKKAREENARYEEQNEEIKKRYAAYFSGKIPKSMGMAGFFVTKYEINTLRRVRVTELQDKLSDDVFISLCRQLLPATPEDDIREICRIIAKENEKKAE